MMADPNYEQYVPNRFKAWIMERPVINSVICLAAGFVLGKLF